MPRVIGETEEQASAKVPMYVSAVRTTTRGSLSNERLGDITHHNGVRLAGLEVDAEGDVGVHGPVDVVAHRHYRQGLEACAKIGFRPEIALIRLQLAELLLAHYPDARAKAIEHLDSAIAELREMKMQPSLEKAEALRAAQTS